LAQAPKLQSDVLGPTCRQTLVAMQSKLLVLLLVAPCLGLKRASPDHAISLGHDSTCELSEATKSLPFALAFGDMAFDAPVVSAKQNASDAPADNKAEWKSAMGEYKAASEKMKVAEGRLMTAMDALLEVPSVDAVHLVERMPKEHMLIVFYAPWCGHCQQFVLHDGSGDPTKAPLELLNKEFKADEKLKDVSVVRFDTQKLGETIPSAFEIKFIPTVYFTHKGGKATVFEGNPGDAAALKAFAEAQAKA